MHERLVLQTLRRTMVEADNGGNFWLLERCGQTWRLVVDGSAYDVTDSEAEALTEWWNAGADSVSVSDDIEMLLAGLDVQSVGELKRLVDKGRAWERRITHPNAVSSEASRGAAERQPE